MGNEGSVETAKENQEKEVNAPNLSSMITASVVSQAVGVDDPESENKPVQLESETVDKSKDLQNFTTETSHNTSLVCEMETNLREDSSVLDAKPTNSAIDQYSNCDDDGVTIIHDGEYHTEQCEMNNSSPYTHNDDSLIENTLDMAQNTDLQIDSTEVQAFHLPNLKGGGDNADHALSKREPGNSPEQACKEAPEIYDSTHQDSVRIGRESKSHAKTSIQQYDIVTAEDAKHAIYPERQETYENSKPYNRSAGGVTSIHSQSCFDKELSAEHTISDHSGASSGFHSVKDLSAPSEFSSDITGTLVFDEADELSMDTTLGSPHGPVINTDTYPVTDNHYGTGFGKDTVIGKDVHMLVEDLCIQISANNTEAVNDPIEHKLEHNESLVTEIDAHKESEGSYIMNLDSVLPFVETTDKGVERTNTKGSELSNTPTEKNVDPLPSNKMSKRVENSTVQTYHSCDDEELIINRNDTPEVSTTSNTETSVERTITDTECHQCDNEINTMGNEHSSGKSKSKKSKKGAVENTALTSNNQLVSDNQDSIDSVGNELKDENNVSSGAVHSDTSLEQEQLTSSESGTSGIYNVDQQQTGISGTCETSHADSESAAMGKRLDSEKSEISEVQKNEKNDVQFVSTTSELQTKIFDVENSSGMSEQITEASNHSNSINLTSSAPSTVYVNTNQSKDDVKQYHEEVSLDDGDLTNSDEAAEMSVKSEQKSADSPTIQINLVTDEELDTLAGHLVNTVIATELAKLNESARTDNTSEFTEIIKPIEDIQSDYVPSSLPQDVSETEENITLHDQEVKSETGMDIPIIVIHSTSDDDEMKHGGRPELNEEKDDDHISSGCTDDSELDLVHTVQSSDPSISEEFSDDPIASVGEALEEPSGKQDVVSSEDEGEEAFDFSDSESERAIEDNTDQIQHATESLKDIKIKQADIDDSTCEKEEVEKAEEESLSKQSDTSIEEMALVTEHTEKEASSEGVDLSYSECEDDYEKGMIENPETLSSSVTKGAFREHIEEYDGSDAEGESFDFSDSECEEDSVKKLEDGNSEMLISSAAEVSIHESDEHEIKSQASVELIVSISEENYSAGGVDKLDSSTYTSEHLERKSEKDDLCMEAKKGSELGHAVEENADEAPAASSLNETELAGLDKIEYTGSNVSEKYLVKNEVSASSPVVKSSLEGDVFDTCESECEATAAETMQVEETIDYVTEPSQAAEEDISVEGLESSDSIVDEDIEDTEKVDPRLSAAESCVVALVEEDDAGEKAIGLGETGEEFSQASVGKIAASSDKATNVVDEHMETLSDQNLELSVDTGTNIKESEQYKSDSSENIENKSVVECGDKVVDSTPVNEQLESDQIDLHSNLNRTVEISVESVLSVSDVEDSVESLGDENCVEKLDSGRDSTIPVDSCEPDSELIRQNKLVAKGEKLLKRKQQMEKERIKWNIKDETPPPTNYGGISTSVPLFSHRGSDDSSSGSEPSIRELKDAFTEMEEKYKQAMVQNAQLDNERTQLNYRVEQLKDDMEEKEEELYRVKKEYKDMSLNMEKQNRMHESLQKKHQDLQEALRQRDELIQEQGLVLVGGSAQVDGMSDDEDVLDVGRQYALVTTEAAQVLQSAGDGSLDVRLKHLAEEKQDLCDEITRLKMQLDEVGRNKESGGKDSGTSGTCAENGVVDMQLLEIQREASKQLSEYKFKLQKSEQEIGAYQANVLRLETQLQRYKATSEVLEKSEDEMRAEKRKLQRDLRSSLDRIEEMEMTNAHLEKRLERMRATRAAQANQT